MKIYKHVSHRQTFHPLLMGMISCSSVLGAVKGRVGCCSSYITVLGTFVDKKSTGNKSVDLVFCFAEESPPSDPDQSYIPLHSRGLFEAL